MREREETGRGSNSSLEVDTQFDSGGERGERGMTTSLGHITTHKLRKGWPSCLYYYK